jgi:hypothetical protein
MTPKKKGEKKVLLSGSCFALHNDISGAGEGGGLQLFSEELQIIAPEMPVKERFLAIPYQ